MEQVRFQFTGGITDLHQMNFYEFGRFQYGAARFVYTLEKFRQSGRVTQRLTSRVDVDIRVKASSEGSFIQDVLVIAAPIITECAIQCSFEAIFAYIWDKIIPPSKAKDVAVELAKLEVQREEQRTLQEGHRTEQVRLMADVANNNNATTQQALSIITQLVTGGEPVHLEGEEIPAENLIQYQRELSSELSRQQIIRENRVALERISPEIEQQLSSQLRKSISEIAKPLEDSANQMEIYAGARSEYRVASIDREMALQISTEQEDDEMTLIRGSIKSFDRENFNGKLRYEDLHKPISFSIRSSNKQHIALRVLAAMGEEEDVWLRFYLVRDLYQVPIRAILVDVLTDEEFSLFN